MRRLIVFLALTIWAFPVSAARPVPDASRKAPVDRAEMEAMKAILPSDNFFFIGNYKDREAWKAAFDSRFTAHILKVADRLTTSDGKSTVPDWDPVWEGKYWNMRANNNSQSGKDIFNKRFHAVRTLTLASCIVDDDRYDGAAVDALTKIVRQPIWVYPRDYRKGAAVQEIELAAREVAENLGVALYIMDDKIPSDLRVEIVDSLYKRIFNPLVRSLEKGSPIRNGWLTNRYNHNPATLSGVLMSALACCPDPDMRAEIACIARKYSYNYTLGFREDGYCNEGVGYYNFGFDKYILIREALYRATGGKVDIYKDNPNLQAVMTFPFGMQMYADLPSEKNSYASIGDCNTSIKPSSHIVFYNLRYLGLDNPAYSDYEWKRTCSTISYEMMARTTDFEHFKGIEANFNPDPLRSFFPNSGILVVRPAPGASSRLAATLKGGHTRESHNHNDIGSYTICLDGTMMAGDPGGAPYTGKTFGPHRYEIRTFSSYGHPVPTVDGVLQQENIPVPAPILGTSFTKNKDVFSIELKSFYPLGDLDSVTRTFTYYRKDSPVLEIRDDFSARGAHVYETAITTRAEISVAKDRIVLKRDGKTLTARIKASGPFAVTTDTIGGVENEAKVPFTRISIKLTRAAKTAAWITIRYSE